MSPPERATATLGVGAQIPVEHALGGTPTQTVIDLLKARGVRALALAKTWRDEIDFVLVHTVEFAGTRFEFARHLDVEDDPVDALAFLARDRANVPADIVAWCPQAGRLASWFGRVSLLGEEQVFAPRLTNTLAVHPTPLEWLAARRRGVVVVDPLRAVSILRDVGPLEAANVEHGRVLRQWLTPPPVNIRVPARTVELVA